MISRYQHAHNKTTLAQHHNRKMTLCSRFWTMNPDRPSTPPRKKRPRSQTPAMEIWCHVHVEGRCECVSVSVGVVRMRCRQGCVLHYRYGGRVGKMPPCIIFYQNARIRPFEACTPTVAKIDATAMETTSRGGGSNIHLWTRQHEPPFASRHFTIKPVAHLLIE